MRYLNRRTGPARRIAALASGLLLTAALVDATQARATYPGAAGSIAFRLAAADGSVNVWAARPDGGRLRQVTHGSGFNACAAYSPDGRQIAFCGTGRVAGTSEIGQVGANGPA
jgi:hypothetical protein